MYSLCLRYARTKDDADDIFQQAFFLVYKNIKQLKNPEALSGWVKRIFVNAAIAHNKTCHHLSIHEDSDGYQENMHENWNHILSDLATTELTQLIQDLPTGCRSVFNLYVIEGYSHKEIAEMLQVSTGTSKSQLFDARKILKKKINARNTISVQIKSH